MILLNILLDKSRKKCYKDTKNHMTYSGKHKQIYKCTCCVCDDTFLARRKFAKYCSKPRCQTIRNKKSSIYHIGRFEIDTFIYERKCLRCDKAYKTRNKYIRLCEQCKKANLYSEDDWCGTGDWR